MDLVLGSSLCLAFGLSNNSCLKAEVFEALRITFPEITAAIKQKIIFKKSFTFFFNNPWVNYF